MEVVYKSIYKYIELYLKNSKKITKLPENQLKNIFWIFKNIIFGLKFELFNTKL